MYEEMTYEKILDDMLDRVDDNLDKREGSIIYDALAPVAYSLARMFFELQHYADLIFPDTSAGEYLDRFAAAFNMKRKEAVRAVKTGCFNIPVPQGSRFSTIGDEAVIYVVTKESGMEGEQYIYELECETAGQIGNRYIGKLLPVNYMNGLGSAELKGIVSEGTDQESDEDFRKRLFDKIRRPSTSGNANDYYNWAMECAGVGAVKVFPLSGGPGTVKVVIADENKTSAGSELIHRVSDYIEGLRPIGADVTIVSAVEKNVDIFAKVKLTKSTNLGTAQMNFQDMVGEYLKDNAFSISYLSPARIGNLLMEVSGVEDYIDLRINGNTGNMEIAEEEIAVVGTVRLEVM